jgi:hypothetical protein
MRSAGGTNSAPPCVVTRATKSVMDFLTAPSFQEGRGLACARGWAQRFDEKTSIPLGRVEPYKSGIDELPD